MYPISLLLQVYNELYLLTSLKKSGKGTYHIFCSLERLWKGLVDNLKGVQGRFRTSLRTYMDAVLHQADASIPQDFVRLEDYIMHHRA